MENVLIILCWGLDLSGLTLQSGPSRLVKDEYSAGTVQTPTVTSPGHMDIDGTVQHHPPPQSQPQFTITALPSYSSGKLAFF